MRNGMQGVRRGDSCFFALLRTKTGPLGLFLLAVCMSAALASPAEAASLVRSATGTKLSNAGTPTSVTATLTTGATAGDMLIAVVGGNGAAVIAGPSGWTSAINESGVASQAIFYKRAAGGETAVTGTVDANPGAIGIHVYEYSGANLFMGASSASGSDAAPASGTVTTTVANELVFAAFTSHVTTTITNSSWADGSEGFTERNDFSTASGGTSRDSTYAAGDNLVNTAGSRSVTVSAAATGDWRGQIVRFQNDVTTPTVSGVTSSTSNGAYRAGQVVSIQVNFSEAVTVTGTPQLTLATGTPSTTAINMSGGSGTSTLTFTYAVASGNHTADLDYSGTTALSLNGGTIKDAAGNNATLTLAAPGTAGSLSSNKDIVIDTAVPTLAVVTPVPTPTGDVTPDFTFSSTQAGTIAYGGDCSSATTTANAGNTTVTFNMLGSGAHSNCTVTVTDAAGNVSSALAVPSFTIDASMPAVTGVTSSLANGMYAAGQAVAIQVSFSEAVNVLGAPQLSLGTGSPATTAVGITGGNGTATLTFTYTVASGNHSADLDYSGTTALSLNGGSIKDAAGNDATLTLPAPGAAGSLGANKNIVID
ncbi:MAG: hypothetical protein RLZZ324_23, partial [Candidatus Parcubacteria bacterium]